MNESSRVTPAQTALAVVLQVRSGVLQALVWQRAMEPFAGAWSLPGGYLEPERRSSSPSAGTSP